MKCSICGLIAILILYGCSVGNQVTIPEPSSPAHIGCQEEEIDVNGICIVAEQNNAAIFEQEPDQYVDYIDIEGGFLAKPKDGGSYPGVVMIHEWWGLNDNIKEMAKILAKEGYVVFAVDLYDGQVAEDSAKASKLAGNARSNPNEAIRKMQEAVDYLKDVENIDKVASIGWCFGGGLSLQLSLNEVVDATVIYYGSLVDDREQLMKLQGPVLGIFGAEDTSIPVSSVNNFKDSLDDLSIENEIYIYEGLGHAFANPSGSNYAEEETIDAWEKTVSFLNSNLKPDNSDDFMDTEVKDDEPITFSLIATNYRFMMNGVEAPELRVKQGDRVRIELKNVEGFHDWSIDEFNAKTAQVSEGNSASVEFVADKKGAFEYYCSVGKHRQLGMKGMLIVN